MHIIDMRIKWNFFFRFLVFLGFNENQTYVPLFKMNQKIVVYFVYTTILFKISVTKVKEPYIYIIL